MKIWKISVVALVIVLFALVPVYYTKKQVSYSKELLKVVYAWNIVNSEQDIYHNLDSIQEEYDSLQEVFAEENALSDNAEILTEHKRMQEMSIALEIERIRDIQSTIESAPENMLVAIINLGQK